MGKHVDLTGQKFGRLTVTGYDKSRKRDKWVCTCDCGNVTYTEVFPLKNGVRVSCGCKKKEPKVEIQRTKISGWHSWRGMLERCNNPRHQKYEYYGGRGISVCERWKDFSLFLEDMGERPSKKHSIDRIDVNGDYEPVNCKWSTEVEQRRNTRVRKDHPTGVRGVYWHKTNSKWFANITIDGSKRISLGYYDDLNDAIDARRKAEIEYWGGVQ